MTYSSLIDCQVAAGGSANLVSLTSQDGGGALDVIVLAKFQAKADGVLNGYLRLRDATPLSAPSQEISDVAASLTVFFLREAKQMLTEHELKAHELRIKWLEEVRAGKIRIADVEPPRSAAVKSAVIPLAGDLTRDTTRGMW